MIASLRAARLIPFLSKRKKERFLTSISRRKAELKARKTRLNVGRPTFKQRPQIAALTLALMCPGLSERAKRRFTRSLAKRTNNDQRLPTAGMVKGAGDERKPARFSEKEAMLRLGLVVAENHIAVDRHLDRECHSILIVSTHMPTTRHAGGLRILDMIEVIKSRNSKVYIELFVSSNKSLLGGAGEAYALVDRVVYAENHDFSLAQYRKQSKNVRLFDVVDFNSRNRQRPSKRIARSATD
nr:hypothetical protein [Marinicella sp. W31]MDC2875479.1 hypothetical protein [Marinicella sp. W31]